MQAVVYMEENAMLWYVLALVALSYVLFVFISDLFNPFIKTKAPLRRRRWHLGRAAALSSLGGGLVALVLFNSHILNATMAASVYGILGLICIIPAALRHKRSALWQ